MLKGVHLTLMIGPAVPVPAPRSVIDALTSVEVTHGKDHSGFQLTFAVGKKSPLLQTMLPAGYFDPLITRVIIIATLGGMPNVLMDGLITTQQMHPSSDPGKSTLTITGEDLSIAMDVVEMVIPYPAMPITAQLYAILGKYAALGIVPLVVPPTNLFVESPSSGWTSQRGTDRAYIQAIASGCGYVFFVRPGPVPGISTAYFGPDVSLPIPQPALSINMDAHTNVEALSFSLNGLTKKVGVFTIYDPITKRIPIPVPIPNIDIFKPPLGARPTPPARVELGYDLTKLKPAAAAQKVLAFLAKDSAAITGTGSLDVMRYGRILQARMLVGVRGAGRAYDGMYYVDSVTNNIKPGEFKQSFTLSRDGLISITPKVPV